MCFIKQNGGKGKLKGFMSNMSSPVFLKSIIKNKFPSIYSLLLLRLKRKSVFRELSEFNFIK